MKEQKQNNQKPAPAKQYVSAKVPYAMKVLEDALRKNEQELELWKKHVRIFSWSRIAKHDLGMSGVCRFEITVALKDGFGTETVENMQICIGADCKTTAEDYKEAIIKNSLNIQAEGNFEPCKNRIQQIKEVISILKQAS